MGMAETQEDAYSVQFALYAGKLEKHLRTNGISCQDADIIIEESSKYYFEKLHSDNRLVRLIRKHDPAELFIQSAARAVQKNLPEAKGTFGSSHEIEKCIR